MATTLMGISRKTLLAYQFSPTLTLVVLKSRDLWTMHCVDDPIGKHFESIVFRRTPLAAALQTAVILMATAAT